MSLIIYKKYAFFILVGFFGIHVLSAIWLYTGYHHPTDDTAWVNGLYEKKEAIAASIKGPKIVVVSGSSGLFSIRAAQLASHFGIPAVNLSTHGGLRDYYIQRAKNSIRSGDLVVFAPEYTQYFIDFPMSGVKSDFIVNFDKDFLKGMPWREQLEILKTYAHPWKILKTVTHEIGRKLSGKEARGYSVRNLNSHGDETSNHGIRVNGIEPLSMSRRFDANAYGMRTIAEFLEWCGAEGATVVVVWPGTLSFKKSPYGAEKRYIDALAGFLSDSGVEVLGKPDDFFVPENYLFDDVYHLNAKGASHHTSQIIRFLEQSPVFGKWRQKNKGLFDPVTETADAPGMREVLPNGGMEKNANNKPLGWRPVVEKNTEDFAVWDNTESRGGSYSLKVENRSAGHARWVGGKFLLPEGIYTIRAGGWSKAENVEAQARYCINFKLFFRDGSSKWNNQGLIFPAGTHDWVPVQTVLNFEMEILAVQPFLLLHGGRGTVWFDDIFIRIPDK